MTLSDLALTASTLSNLIFGAFLLIFALGVIYGFYTRRGSAIDQHPQGDSRRGSPGVGAGSSRVAGEEDGEQDRMDTHGTK